jgi:hypothetical protein
VREGQGLAAILRGAIGRQPLFPAVGEKEHRHRRWAQGQARHLSRGRGHALQPEEIGAPGQLHPDEGSIGGSQNSAFGADSQRHVPRPERRRQLEE